MWKIVRRILLLLAVFIAGLVGFSKLIYHEENIAAEELGAAENPVIYFVKDDISYNRLCGYLTELEAGTVRDCVTPVGEDRALLAVIDTNGAEVTEISYQVRDLSDDHLVQSTEVDTIEITSETIETELIISDLLEEGSEYELEIIVKTGDESFYFYTMVVDEPKSSISECVDGAVEFHDDQFSADGYDKILEHMETLYASDSLWYVDLYDSADQVRWGSVPIEDITPESDILLRITECSEVYNVITIDYVISYEDSEYKYYYEVAEYYRLRWDETTEQTYILSFERTTNEIFTGEACEVDENALVLGITDPDVSVMANEELNTVCFVQQGELWNYNLNDNRVTRIFSFRDSSYENLDETTGDYEIKILRMKENGDVFFAVCGYMERGVRESRSGVCVYRYINASDTIEEKVFIPASISGQMSMAEIGKIMYVTNEGEFLVSAGSAIYRIDLETGECETQAENVESESICTSESGRYAAWLEDDLGGISGRIMVADLEEMSVYTILPQHGDYIKPLGIIGEDLITGEAFSGDVQTGADGTGYMMSYINILSVGEDGQTETKKTYHEDGIYISSVAMSGGELMLDRYRKTATGYEKTDRDLIMNQSMYEDQYVSVGEKTDSVRENLVTLSFSMEIPQTAPSVVYSKIVISDEPHEVVIGEDFMDSSYYVYAKGGLARATNYLSTAIRSAEEDKGVVTDSSQMTIWTRNKPTYSTIRQISEEDKRRAADPDGEGGTNIVGVTLSEALYFVSEGICTTAVDWDGKDVVITGYDAANVYLYYVENDNSQEVSIDEAEEKFEVSGNMFCVFFD